jgi:hypothetical protein
MKKIAIKGDGTEETGKKIIKYLESLGGVNTDNRCGDSNGCYYINDMHNAIRFSPMHIPIGYTLITLPQELTFPRRMLVSNDNGCVKTWDNRIVLLEKGGFYHAVGFGYEEEFCDNSRAYVVDKWSHAKELPQESESDVQIRELEAQIAQISETIKKLKEVDRCSK